MKKIIGLIMIAGISYGASVVTPPGIQVNGLATNNNVMVYSNGMLLDSGVAPTNLVSVTNLTADIEALSATNAAQDALIAGNLYAAGTTNKTLIDAAIGAIDQTTLGITNDTIVVAGWGQSNMAGYTLGTNYLFASAFAPNTNAYFSSAGKYTTTSDHADSWNFQQFLEYTNYIPATETSDISWGVEFPVSKSLTDLGKTVYYIKSAVGGAGANTFIPGGAYWLYVTNAYASAQSEWPTMPAVDILIFMRGESGAATQTQSESYAERLAVYQAATNLYGNPNLQLIMTGLPASYYALANGPDVEAGAQQLANENDNCWYVETHDIPEPTNHYGEKNMLEVGARIMGVVDQIIANRNIKESAHYARVSSNDAAFDHFRFRTATINNQDLTDYLADVAIDKETYGYYQSPMRCKMFLPFEGDVIDPINAATNTLQGLSSVVYDEHQHGGVLDLGDHGTANSNYVDVASNIYASNNFTIAFWYNCDYVGNAPDCTIVGRGATTIGSFSVAFFGSADNFVYAYWRDSGGTINGSSMLMNATYQDTWNDGEWHSYVITVGIGTGNVDLYVDGIHHDSTAMAGTADKTTCYFSKIGYGWSGNGTFGCIGKLDQLQFFNSVVFSAEDVAAWHRRTKYGDSNIRGY